MDFSTIYPATNIGDSNSSSNSIQDCILVLEFLNETGRRQRQYMDFLCDIKKVNTNDYFFVNVVWQQLMQLDLAAQFDSIEIWSDGGPHHFKTRYCQWSWHHFSSCYFQGKRITHNFFAAYHGHSLADSHAGRDKQVIKAEYLSSQHSRLQLLPLSARPVYWGPSSARDVQIILQKKIENTTAVVLADIDRDPQLKPAVAGLPNIKQYHSFFYENNRCYMAELTNDGNPTSFRFQYL